MQAIILCGGKGTRLGEFTVSRPKPMVDIGPRPILWHIMKGYAQHGVSDFVLCLGYKGEMIKDYFLNYGSRSTDFTVTLGRHPSVEFHSRAHDEDGWRVTLVETGADTMTGGRVARASRYLSDGDDTFALTYADAVSDIDLSAALAFHRQHGKKLTVAGVRPPSRFGVLQRDGERVLFSEKPQRGSDLINGGFFFCQRSFLDYLSEDEGCVLERAPLERCGADGELRVYHHDGYWQCMDTQRDWEQLQATWNSGSPPWKTWS